MTGDSKKITYYFEDQAEHLLLSDGELASEGYFVIAICAPSFTMCKEKF